MGHQINLANFNEFSQGNILFNLIKNTVGINLLIEQA